MGIAIETDYIILATQLNLSTNQIQEQYSGMAIDEIIEAEAALGNAKALEFVDQLMNNTELVMELFGLADPSNKYYILNSMDTSQLQDFLPLLEEDDLNFGLNYFSRDKLLALIEEIPMDQVVNTMFQMFSEEEVALYMPEEDIDKFLTNTEIDKDLMLEHLKSIPPEYLAQMLESVTGEISELTNSVALTSEIEGLNPLDYNNALMNLQPMQKRELMLSLGNHDEELYQLFDATAYTGIIEMYKQKPDVVEAMNIIESEFVIEMLTDLPDDILSYVITQLDTQEFTEQLVKECPDIMAKMLAGG
ncbi:MAG: hypothetical protein R3Y28_08595 [Candidatus Gastranaerophilales bacterium]